MRDERRWLDIAPDETTWAEVTAPAQPSRAEHSPAAVHWRDLLVDPDKVGLITGDATATRIDIRDAGNRSSWTLPVSGVLTTPLAWHPLRPWVAGLVVVDDYRVHPWIADYQQHTLVVHEQLQAATSCTSFGAAPPLAWCRPTGLVLLIPRREQNSPANEPNPDARPVLLEASGPSYLEFTPGIADLLHNAGARVAVFDVETHEITAHSEPLLVRHVHPEPETSCVTVGYAERVDEDPVEARFHWRQKEIKLAHPRSPDARFSGAEDGRTDDVPEQPRAGALTTQPDLRRHRITTRYGNSWLTVPQEHEKATVLWIRACSEETREPEVPVPNALLGAGHPVAGLDLNLHWPSDATLGMLREQLTDVLNTAVQRLTEHRPDRKIVVGGHSFGATLALYALANVAGFVAGIAHSGCYNRMLTLTGFHYEHRTYWEAPEIYQAFSSVHFADRLAGPVLLAHGTADTNPATTPDQAVEFYRAVVAAGGRARIALFPREGHNFHYRETRAELRAEHRDWLVRWGG